MVVAAAFVATAVVARLLWASLRPAFGAAAVARTNHRGLTVPVGAGVALVVAVVVVEAGLRVAEVLGRDPAVGERSGRALVLVAALGFALLGLFDDLVAEGDDRGFKGHLRAAAQGRLTTGGLKLAAGGALAVLVVAGRPDVSFAEVVVGALVVALAANLGNLFDRAPGRTTKVALVAAVGLAVAAGPDDARLVGVAMVVGAGAGLLWPDLREQLMLGDAGANVLGAALGVGAVMVASTPVQVGLLVALAALNLLSEVVSFSRVIDRTPPLRVLDRWGRRP